jgi:DNA polymerase-3 subunit delta'
MIHPWNKELWRKLLRQAERLPHAILLSGPSGVGKRDFAMALAARMLCETSSGEAEACGTCPSCNWFASGNHPDFRLIEPMEEEASEDAGLPPSSPRKKPENIRIDQIRALDEFLCIGTHRRGARIIVIHPAEAMNPPAANSLLKMLEEPTPSTLFILITSNKKRLLPTILSRCRAVNFRKPPAAQALAWLRESGIPHVEDLLAHAGGMPLAALGEGSEWERLSGFLQDLMQLEAAGPIVVAGRWEAWLKDGSPGGIDKRTLVTWMQKWVFDLVAMKLAGVALFHTFKLDEVRRTAARTSVAVLIDCYNDLSKIKAAAQHPLNPRLFLEDMLSRYARAVSSGR